MHRSALERVVVVLAVRRGAVDEGRVVGTETARVSERRAATFADCAGERGANVVGAAGRDRQTDDVEQQAPTDRGGFARRLGLRQRRRPAATATGAGDMAVDS